MRNLMGKFTWIWKSEFEFLILESQLNSYVKILLLYKCYVLKSGSSLRLWDDCWLEMLCLVIEIYGVYTCTVYTRIRCIHVYDVYTYTMYTRIRCIHVYDVYTYTMYTRIRCIHVYDVYTYTMYTRIRCIHLYDVYTYTMYTRIRCIHVYDVYTCIHASIWI